MLAKQIDYNAEHVLRVSRMKLGVEMGCLHSFD